MPARVKRPTKKDQKPKEAPKKAAKPKEAKKGKTVAGKKAKKKDEDDDSQVSVNQWFEGVNKDRKYAGKAQILMASQVRTPYYLRRPSGILSLDVATGGGLHAGGIAEVQGI